MMDKKDMFCVGMIVAEGVAACLCCHFHKKKLDEAFIKGCEDAREAIRAAGVAVEEAKKQRDAALQLAKITQEWSSQNTRIDDM